MINPPNERHAKKPDQRLVRLFNARVSDLGQAGLTGVVEVVTVV